MSGKCPPGSVLSAALFRQILNSIRVFVVLKLGYQLTCTSMQPFIRDEPSVQLPSQRYPSGLVHFPGMYSVLAGTAYPQGCAAWHNLPHYAAAGAIRLAGMRSLVQCTEEYPRMCCSRSLRHRRAFRYSLSPRMYRPVQPMTQTC